MITFHGYKKCSTCRKAEKALEAAGIPYTFVDITETPPSKSALKKILELSGVPVRKLFNTSGEQYKLLGIKDKVGVLTDAAALELLAGNGRLIKRPLVSDGVRATVGFDPETFIKTWRGSR
jgi:arsenate reductase (glutaredoxin)